MKKMIFAATAIAAAFASCTEHNENSVNPDVLSGDGRPQVQITLGADDATRAFFDETATAEPWENELTRLEVSAFDQSGNLIARRLLTTREVEAKSARISLPHSATGTTCSFYVIANLSYSQPGSFQGFDNLILTDSESNNGTFEEVTAGHKREAGFVMTGKATATIVGGDSYTRINVPLRRVVAKVALRTSVDEAAFSTATAGGKVTITSARVHKTLARTYLFAEEGRYDTSDNSYQFTQASTANGNHFDNLFYIYENGPRPTGERVAITLSGYFDADGNAATVDDRTDVEYNLELGGSGDGAIRRNGYYRVNAVIEGLPGDGVAMNCLVAGWETPENQNVVLGN